MDRKEFARLVNQVLATLPDEFAARVDGVEVVIEDEPSRAQIRNAGLDPKLDTLFGLYEGVPIGERGSDYVGLPDKITLFYRPIVDACESREEIREEIRLTVLHEVAHFFGIGDEELDRWGY